MGFFAYGGAFYPILGHIWDIGCFLVFLAMGAVEIADTLKMKARDKI
jgi:hypothetical protein